MSIKRRILLSNIIMMLLVLVFLLSFLFFMIQAYTERYFAPSPEDIYNREAGDFTLTELEVVVEDVASILRENDGVIQNSSQYPRIRNFLDSTETVLLIQRNGSYVYLSDGCTESAADQLIDTYINSQEVDTDTAFYTDDNALVCKTNLDMENGDTVTLFVINTSDGISAAGGESKLFSPLENSRALSSLRVTAIFGIGIVVLINLVMVFVIARSIMKPLDLLKKGTKMISEGNLDFEIDYNGNDEISEVIDNFEDMRRKLSLSTEQQRRYEISRKTLIAGISHDLSTPLTSIKGYVSGLLDGIADSPEKQEKYLKTIYNTAEEMDRLVNELFLFSKLDMDKVPFHFEKVDIGEYLASCCDEMKFTFEKDKLLIGFTDRLESPASVFLDRNQFGRVLLNIARNSVKYKKEEVASLHVDLSMADPEPQEEDLGETTAVSPPKMVRIVLKDNGIGVPAELTERIFESFYRRDPARSNPTSGSGLGLAIAKQIVNRHCGVISAESVVGLGLSIIIDLPVAGENREMLYREDDRD